MIGNGINTNIGGKANSSIKKPHEKLIIDCRRMLAEKQLDADYYAIGLGKE